MNQLQDMIGPEFLDALADAEAANSNDINACAMRSNAVAWANDRRRLRELEQTVSEQADRLADIRRTAQAG